MICIDRWNVFSRQGDRVRALCLCLISVFNPFTPAPDHSVGVLGRNAHSNKDSVTTMSLVGRDAGMWDIPDEASVGWAVEETAVLAIVLPRESWHVTGNDPWYTF